MKTKINTYVISLVVIFCVLVVRLFALPLSAIHGDEYCFATISQGIVKGIYPYKYMFEHKPLGLYYFYSLPMFILGDNIYSLRLIPIFVTVLSSIFIFNIFNRSSRSAAIFAAAIYSLSLLGPTGEGFASDSEILINMFVFGVIYYLFFSCAKYAYQLAATFIAFAISTNYLALPIVCALVMYRMYCFRFSVAEIKKLVGLIFVIILICSSFYIPNIINGDLMELFQWQFRVISTYTKDPFNFPLEFSKIGKMFLMSVWLWVAVILALIVRFFYKKSEIVVADDDTVAIAEGRLSQVPHDPDIFTIGLILFFVGFFCYVSPRQYWPHHFLILYSSIPFLIFEALKYSKIVRAVVLILMIVNVYVPSKNFIRWGAEAWSNVYRGDPPDYVSNAATIIKNHQCGKTLYVYSAKNQHQGLYYLSGIRPASEIPLWNQVTFQSFGPRILGRDSLSEFQNIISTHPRAIVVDADYPLADSSESYDVYLRNELSQYQFQRYYDMKIYLLNCDSAE